MAGKNPYDPLLYFIGELKACDAADLTSAFRAYGVRGNGSDGLALDSRGTD
jgi:hypothetical protein